MARKDYEAGSVAVHGVEVFAGIMLIVGGGFQVIQSIVAIARDEYIVVLPNYVFSLDLTGWGWIHLVVGLILAGIGACLLLGQGWARIAGIVVAGISALINFSWLPYSPWWALLVIAVDILVIWALATLRRGSATSRRHQ
jgi:hypothetical protein